jgi:glycosidase
MLIKNSFWVDCLPSIKKEIDGVDVSARGCFAFGECPEFTVEAPRKLGASAVVMRICRDGGEDVDYPFQFISTDMVRDTYKLKIDTAALCGGDSDGLFFYEILFLRGADTLFTSTENNVTFSLERYSERRFLMLVYQKGFSTPEWFHGRVMYQVFVDRFYKGVGEVGTRDDVIVNEDWENGIPQYVEHQGEPIKNNMFFGGNLWGVAEKLEYLKSLGVGVIYLNPIFKAYSNHKYDTGDYFEIDSMFGGKAAFDNLIKKASELDIKIILDGVFNHTGDNSLYFDRYGEYGNVGAYSSENSKYRNWFCFKGNRDNYDSWWGIKILPRLNHSNEDCRRYFTGENGVGAEYIKQGVAGWRLDVADELSDDFLDEFCQAVKQESNGEAIIIGEVWENATEKVAYGKRRKYLRGAQLDSVMNYPLRKGIMRFVLDGDAEFLSDILQSIYSTYPKTVCDSLMNILGTHDTERALTVFGKGDDETCDEAGSILAYKRLSSENKKNAIKKMKLATAIQYTVYGVPSVYYGDEAGLEGYRDPFCRMPYPWGKEESELVEFYRTLGKIREENRNIFAEGEFKVDYIDDALIVYIRSYLKDKICVIANASNTQVSYTLPGRWRSLVDGKRFDGNIDAYSAVILKRM